MVSARATILTDRQVEVLELRERGLTQRAVAERLGTTASNVSAVERAAEENVEKARHTLELVRTIRSPVRFSVPPGTEFDALVSAVYDRGDEAGIPVAYCRPELYAHLYGAVEAHTDRNQLVAEIEVGLTSDGDVRIYTDAPGAGA